eukprot:3216363-Lingulodinium_polyedra.AAC.1
MSTSWLRGRTWRHQGFGRACEKRWAWRARRGQPWPVATPRRRAVAEQHFVFSEHNASPPG